MTDNHLSLFCLVDGESTSKAFPVEIESIQTVGHLKKLIKTEKTPRFDDVAADELTLWRVSIPDDNQGSDITIHALEDKTELNNPRSRLSKLFPESPDDNTYIIVQRPQGDLRVDIKKITDKFFAPGTPTTKFLDAFVKGKGDLPVTTGSLSGLPRAWRRGFGVPAETRPSLLFLDLPDPLTPDSASRNVAAGSILDMDIFNNLFRQLLNLRHHREIDLSDLVRNQFEGTKYDIIKHGGLPNIKEDTRLLVVHDEAQFLGDEFSGDFQSMSSSDQSPRPLLSPILHAFRDVGDDQLTLVTCGTGLSINTLFWVQSSGSGLKDSSTTFEVSWTSKESINAYISRVRDCLQDEQSKLAMDEFLSQEAVEMLFQKFVGRYRPAIAAIERIVECNDTGAWKKTIEDAEDRLVSWAHRHIKGNLCYEISRLHDKHNKYKDQLVESIDSMLGLLMYQRCMFGNHDLVLKEVDPQLVEHAFGRIKIIRGKAVTVMDEPFVSKAVENYFAAIDPYFAKEVRKRMVKSTAIEQGCVFERFMMKVFSETFNTRPLSGWPHQPPISDMCPALVGKVEIVGWREPGLEQGTTHTIMSMEEFMDAHVNQGSTRNNMSVAPFFFPKSKPSGPDLVFFIRIDGARLVPVFVQMKLHQGSSNFSEKDWNDALSTVSAPKIEGHAKNFRKYCPDNVYISMIVAYPTKWTDKLPASSDLPKDPSGVQQVVINISDDNFGDIFPQEHVEFIDRLKNARKRSADDDDSNDEDYSKKKRS
ncbi:hypothetical protein BG000_000169 [Podila horticola]|nr:hypothetical protein BG000_000169 [Podila horticola]